MIIAFLSSILLTGAVLSKVLEQRAQDEVTANALTLIQTLSSVRNYTDTYINPLLEPRISNESAFLPETIPAFSAIQVFEDLRKNEKYKNFIYREATLNPSNLRDKADDFETKLIESFTKKPNTKEISDFRTLSAGRAFYIARPLSVTKESCLTCHSTPEKAPKSQLATYGKENGFGWKLNQIIGAQVVYVPADKIFESAQQSLYLFMGILLVSFALIVLLINLLLKKTVIQPIRQIAKAAQEVSTGKISADFTTESNDEIGILATAFNRMKASLEIALKLLNREQ